MEGTLSTSLWQHQCLQPPSLHPFFHTEQGGWVVPQALPSDCLEPPVLPGASIGSLLRRVPVRTIFKSRSEDGVCAIAISQDAKYLVTISAATVQVKRISPLSQLCRIESWKFFAVQHRGGGNSAGESRFAK